MSEKKIEELFMIVHKYTNNYASSQLVDYYDLFKLNKSDSNKEILISLRKLRTLIHPDLYGYLPEFMQSSYLEIEKEFKDCIDIFSDINKRELYDKNLEENKKNTKKGENISIKPKEQKSKEAEKSSSSTKQHNEKNTFENVDEFSLNRVVEAIEATTKRHGLFYMLGNLEILFQKIEVYKNNENWINVFSRETEKIKNVRENLEKIGLEKVKEIIRLFAENEKTSDKGSIINFYAFFCRNDMDITNMEIFQEACKETMNKYSTYHLKVAIANYINRQDARNFTNQNGYRDLLKEKINPSDIKPFIYIYLNKFYNCDPTIYSYENLSSLPEDYIINLFTNKFYEEERKKEREKGTNKKFNY